MFEKVKNKLHLTFISLRFDKKSKVAAALFLLPSLILFICFPYILNRSLVLEKSFGDVIRILAFLSLGLLAAGFQFIKIDMPNKVRQIISWIVLLIFPALCTLAVEVINHTDLFSDLVFRRILANYLCYLLIFAFFYALSNRTALACGLGSFISLFYGIANYFVTSFRSSPILPWDYHSLHTALEVSDRYDYTVTDAAAFFILLFCCLISAISRVEPDYKCDSKKKKILERGIAVIVTASLYFFLFPFNILADLDIHVWAWDQATSTKSTGVLAGFTANIQFLRMEKPQNYSSATVSLIEDQINDLKEPPILGNPGKKPNIIAVMCESMTDVLHTNPSLSLSQDNMPFIHSLQKDSNVISGTAYSSVYAGSTANSEYEFLTSNSMFFFPLGTVPYQQYVTTPQHSLVGVLGDYGYQSMVIHPANRKNYSRDRVYDFFGFEEYTDYYLFKTDKTYERGYTDDASCYNELIHEFENKRDNTPLFAFLITLANHGGYEMEDYPETVRVLADDTDYSGMNQYLTSTKSSDTAFKGLIDYFKKEKEPTVILFFGDHWPYTGSNEQMDAVTGAADFSGSEKEEFLLGYQVPYLIWANYDLEQPEKDITSLNYLSGLLMQSAGLESSPYQKYLHHLSETIPVISGNIVIDSDENIYWPDEDMPYKDLLNEYAILQYNNVLDSANRFDELFTASTMP